MTPRTPAALGAGFLLVALAQFLRGAPPWPALAGAALLLLAAGVLLAEQPRTPASPTGPGYIPARVPAPVAEEPAPTWCTVALPTVELRIDPQAPDEAIVEIISTLSPADFERFCKLLLESMGYQHVEISNAGPDNGIDLVAVDGDGLIIGQCKRTRRPTTEPELREFWGALADARADLGIYITLGRFTGPARTWARDKALELYNGPALAAATRRHLLKADS